MAVETELLLDITNALAGAATVEAAFTAAFGQVTSDLNTSVNDLTTGLEDLGSGIVDAIDTVVTSLTEATTALTDAVTAVQDAQQATPPQQQPDEPSPSPSPREGRDGVGGAEGLNLVGEGLEGKFGGIAKAAFPAIGAVAGFTAALGGLVKEGTDAITAGNRIETVFKKTGEDFVNEKLQVAGYSGSVADLAEKTGTLTSKLELQNAKFGEGIIQAGGSAKAAEEYTKKFDVLAAAISARNPTLGDTAAIQQRLNRGLARGGPLLAQYGISLTTQEIQQRASIVATELDIDKKSMQAKQIAGVQLAMEKLQKTAGPLGDVIAKGAEQPAIAFRRLKTTITETVEKIGIPLVEPILKLTQALQPVLVDVMKTLGSILEAAVPVISALIVPLVSDLEPAFKSIQDIMKSLAPDITLVANEFGKAFSPVIADAAKLFVGALDGILAVAAPIIDFLAKSGIAATALEVAFAAWAGSAIIGGIASIGTAIAGMTASLLAHVGVTVADTGAMSALDTAMSVYGGTALVATGETTALATAEAAATAASGGFAGAIATVAGAASAAVLPLAIVAGSIYGVYRAIHSNEGKGTDAAKKLVGEPKTIEDAEAGISKLHRSVVEFRKVTAGDPPFAQWTADNRIVAGVNTEIHKLDGSVVAAKDSVGKLGDRFGLTQQAVEDYAAAHDIKILGNKDLVDQFTTSWNQTTDAVTTLSDGVADMSARAQKQVNDLIQQLVGEGPSLANAFKQVGTQITSFAEGTAAFANEETNYQGMIQNIQYLVSKGYGDVAKQLAAVKPVAQAEKLLASAAAAIAKGDTGALNQLQSDIIINPYGEDPQRITDALAGKGNPLEQGPAGYTNSALEDSIAKKSADRAAKNAAANQKRAEAAQKQADTASRTAEQAETKANTAVANAAKAESKAVTAAEKQSADRATDLAQQAVAAVANAKHLAAIAEQSKSAADISAAQSAVREADSLAQQANAAAKEAGVSVASAKSSANAASHAASAATKAANLAHRAAQKTLTELQKMIDIQAKAEAPIIAAIDGILGALRGKLPSFQSVFAQLGDTGNFNTLDRNLQKQVKKTHEFFEQLKDLRARGFNDLAAEIAKQGPLQGRAIAKSATKASDAMLAQITTDLHSVSGLTKDATGVFGSQDIGSSWAAQYAAQLKADSPKVVDAGLEIAKKSLAEAKQAFSAGVPDFQNYISKAISSVEAGVQTKLEVPNEAQIQTFLADLQRQVAASARAGNISINITPDQIAPLVNVVLDGKVH